jgi:hypothetical protein
MLNRKHLILLLTLLCPSVIFAATNAEHAHTIHVLVLVLMLVFIVAIRLRRIIKISQAGPKRFSLIGILLLVIVFSAVGPLRAFQYQSITTHQNFLYMLYAWGGAYALVTVATVLFTRKIAIEKQDKHFLIPSTAYLVIMILLLLYLVTIYVSLFYNRDIIFNSAYLISTSAFKGVMAGYYLGLAIGMFANRHGQPEKTVIDA